MTEANFICQQRIVNPEISCLQSLVAGSCHKRLRHKWLVMRKFSCILGPPVSEQTSDEARIKNVKLSPAAFVVLDGLVKELGMKQWVVVERLLTWLANQPDEVKRQLVLPGGDP